MIRIFGGPARYIQGAGAFDMVAQTAAPHGARPLIIIDHEVHQLLQPRLDAQFDGISHTLHRFSGEVTVAAIEVIAAKGRADRADLVIGIGGGKALDAAKGAAVRLQLQFLSVPTVASNDSPTSMSLAVYDDHHAIVAIERLERSPVAVVVDTEVIAGAPPHFLLSGIGDAIAKKFEAERSALDGGQNFHGTSALHTARLIADGCYRTLRQHAAEAMQSARDHVVSESLEAVVEANILMAGIGWEAAGLSIAHGIVRGIVASRVTSPMHGMHVAYALLVQLAFEGRDEAFLTDIMDFYRSIGLPCRLADLGMNDPTPQEIEGIARRSLIGPAGGMIVMPQEPTALIRSIQQIESIA